MINPLCIDALRLMGGGRIGLIGCPGRFRLFGHIAIEADGVEQDLTRLRRWGAQALVTLAEPDELALMGVTELAMQTSRAGLRWFHCPMQEDAFKDDTHFERLWQQHHPAVHRHLDAGDDVIIHCVSGYGRCGVLLARILIERGIGPERAIALSNTVRPGVIRNAREADYILNASWPGISTSSTKADNAPKRVALEPGDASQ